MIVNGGVYPAMITGVVCPVIASPNLSSNGDCKCYEYIALDVMITGMANTNRNHCLLRRER
jgi:hypothetical protein